MREVENGCTRMLSEALEVLRRETLRLENEAEMNASQRATGYAQHRGVMCVVCGMSCQLHQTVKTVAQWITG